MNYFGAVLVASGVGFFALPLSAATCGSGVTTATTSATHHTVSHSSPVSLSTNAFTTRITGRLSSGPDVFDVTVNTLGAPPDDPAVQSAMDQAKQAINAAAGHTVAITGPTLLSSASQSTSTTLTNVTGRTSSVNSFLTVGPAELCVGEIGEVPIPPTAPILAPCSPTASQCSLTGGARNVNTNTHTLIDVYTTLNMTGILTTSRYELVGQGSPPSPAVVVPIVLSSAGLNGAFFTSELALSNRGTANASITYAYTAAFGGSSGTASDTLAAGRQKIVPDVITYLRDLGIPAGDFGNRGGTLRITFSGLSSSDAGAATVRTTTAVAEGRAGLAYPGLAASRLLSAPVTLCGLRQNATDRSNVAVINAGGPTEGEIMLRLTVVSGDPANPQALALPDVPLSPGGFSQISGILSSNGLALANGYVRIERISGSAPFFAYAVINDQANSDGSFVEPVPANAPLPIAGMTLPVIVETSTFSSEAVLTNFSASPRTLNFTYVSSALPGGSASFTLALLPKEQQILPFFVQLLRDRRVIPGSPGATFAGALFITDATGDLRGVSIGARTSSAGGGGRYGLFYSAVPSGSEATTSAWLYGLQQNSENRTNLALVNVGSTDSSADVFHIDLYDGATGLSAGSTDVMVPARGFAQVNTILAVYAPGVANGYAHITRTSGSNPFVAYAVVNDGAQPGQRSGDGAFVSASVPSP